MIIIKNPYSHSSDIKFILKFIQNHKRYQVVKAILSQKSDVRGITVASLKIDLSALVTEVLKHCNKNKHIDQWNKIKDSNVIAKSKEIKSFNI